MKINIIAIGKIKNNLVSSINEYLKMISKYTDIEIIELKEELITQKASEANIKQALDKEGEAILKRINDRDFVYALSPNGKTMASPAFSDHLMKALNDGQSRVNFVIGSSYGLSDHIYKRANFTLSFSDMTFPHQLFRVMLLEQIFRAFKIKNNEVYHK